MICQLFGMGEKKVCDCFQNGLTSLFLMYLASYLYFDFQKNVISLEKFAIKFFKGFIYSQRGGKVRRKRGRETSMCGCLLCNPQLGTWPTAQACALTGNPTSNPLVRRPVLSALSYTSQGSIKFLSVTLVYHFINRLFKLYFSHVDRYIKMLKYVILRILVLD